MSSNLLIKEKSPSYYEEDVLRYLEQQQKLQCAGESDFKLPKIHSATVCINSILEDVLQAIEKRQQAKVEFQKALRAHNQYDLFDLSTIIRNFNIDENMYDKLTFHETLVVAMFEEGPFHLRPEPVGGLCLNIEKARGSQPLQRVEPSFDDDTIVKSNTNIDNDETKEINTQDNLNMSKSTSAAKVDSPSNIELLEYMKHLKNEMKREHCKFLVHLSSQFDYYGKNAGSRITTWLDKNFHTLEEKRTEYLFEDKKLIEEKSLYVSLQKKRYYVKHVSSKENLIDRKCYSLSKARHYVSEGANFVLMRYLAVSRYIGQFELSSMYINGDMCRNIYNCVGPESGIINDKKLDLCKINRTIIEECGITHQCITVLTLDGQIVKQDWKDCNIILMVNPLAEVSKNVKQPHKIPLRNTWEDDMQIFSRYLDFKNMHCAHIKSYLADHREVKNIVADYVQHILQMKPKEILDYTVNYFLQYIPEYMPRNEYLEGVRDEEEEEQVYITV